MWDWLAAARQNEMFCLGLYYYVCYFNSNDLSRGTFIETIGSTNFRGIGAAALGAILGTVPGAILGVLFISIEVIIIRCTRKYRRSL